MALEAYQQLEVEWAEFSGFAPAQVVACSSGTAALHLALEALQLPLGSEVIAGDFNMIAVPRAIAMAGMVPVFVDCGEDLLIRPDLIHGGSGFPLSVSAVMAAHVYGRVVDMSRVAEFARVNTLAVIEDLAEAHGVRPHPQTDAACWSFYKNKIIAGEEGGIVAFRNPEHAALARRLRSLGFTAKHDFRHIPRGHNYRLSNCHAKLIRDSLRAYPGNLERRREVESWYEAECPAEWRMPPRDAPWVFDLRIPGLADQDGLIDRLKAAGIMARHWFAPMSEQAEFVNCRVIGSGNAGKLSREGIYLPIHPGITREQVCRSFEIIKAR